MTKELIEYVNFESIVKDFNLKSGDLTPSQQGIIEKILEEYIQQNKNYQDINGEGTLSIQKRKDGKYYWKYKFKSGKQEDWPVGFNTKADAINDFMYRSK
jgi:hypothetical protein